VKNLCSINVKTKKYKFNISSMWIRTKWQHITPAVTVKSFNMCCISTAVDNTDNDMMWNGNEQDGNGTSECEEDNGTDCDDAGSDIDL
jgi:hypothetical protein